jgi:hypothetical protein
MIEEDNDKIEAAVSWKLRTYHVHNVMLLIQILQAHERFQIMYFRLLKAMLWRQTEGFNHETLHLPLITPHGDAMRWQVPQELFFIVHAPTHLKNVGSVRISWAKIVLNQSVR